MTNKDTTKRLDEIRARQETMFRPGYDERYATESREDIPFLLSEIDRLTARLDVLDGELTTAYLYGFHKRDVEVEELKSKLKDTNQ